MWIPAQTTMPPGASARSAAGTSSPAVAKMIAASSGSGGRLVACARPFAAERRRERLSALRRPGFVKANTRRPCHAATWQIMCAAEPKPYRPRRSPSPASVSAR